MGMVSMIATFSISRSVSFSIILAGSHCVISNIMDFANHGDNMAVSQPLRAIEICRIQGQLKRKRPELATIADAKLRRHFFARGPVSMSEIRRIQDVLYSKSAMSV